MEESIFTAAEAVRQILQALTRIQELLYSSATDDTLPEVDVQLSSIRVASHMLANGWGIRQREGGSNQEHRSRPVEHRSRRVRENSFAVVRSGRVFQDKLLSG